MGEDAYIDVHIQVASRISVSEGHMIADLVKDKLLENFEEIVDVLVHTDPEDDEDNTGAVRPPSRTELLINIRLLLGSFYEQIQDIKIHYLDGSVELEVILPLSMVSQIKETETIKRKCCEIEKEMDVVSKTQVFFEA